MQKEPLAVTTAIRIILLWMVQGLVIFGVVTLDEVQHGWLTIGSVGAIEAFMWLIARNEVWSPAGAPTHPPTEALWSTKVAAAEASGAHALETQKAEYEGRLTATTNALAVAVDGEFAVPAGAGGSVGRHVAPLDFDTVEAQVDSINPGQDD